MRFVHAADVHLDSPLRGLSAYEGAPVDAMRGATRRALENLVALCIDEKAELLLLAGDLFDGDWRDYATGLFFASQMSRLREAGVTVVFARGNHDAQSRITRSLTMPDNVLELGASKPETRRLERLGIAVHGQSFAERAVTRDLALAYPGAETGVLNVGVLHTSLTGREGHEPYAPTTLATLASRGYEYWALGHVHAREVVSSSPWVVFPGNLQGRHAREAGAKGATLVTVEGASVVAVEARAVDAVRWAVCEVDVSAAADGADVVDLVRSAVDAAATDAGVRPLAARVVLIGATRAHEALARDVERCESEVRRVAMDVGDDVWIEKVRLRTRGMADAAALAAREDAVGQLARALGALVTDEDAAAEVFAEVRELWSKLPAELREGEDALRLDDPETRRDILRDVSESLLPRLLSGDE
jgi:DNA repair exonuclease SbcCD nuclease subunit